MDDSTSSLLAGDEDVLRNLSSAAWVKTISGSDEPRVSSAAFAFNPVSVNRAALITPAQSAGMLSDIEHVAEFNVGLADTIGFDTRDEVDNKYPENKAHAHVYPKSDVKNKKLKRARKKLAEACILHTI